jgi:hypothetical protein
VYRVDRTYRVDKILSSIVLLLQSGSVHDDDDDTLDTIAIMQLVVPYQDKYHTIVQRTLSSTVPSLVSSLIFSNISVRRSASTSLVSSLIFSNISVRRSTSGTVPSLVASSTSITTLILLFRLAYRVDRIYRVDTILSSIVLLLLQSEYDRDDLIFSTTTVRRTLSSHVPSLASGYSTTTTNGELTLLCRLAYRVNRMYRVGKIPSSIVLLLLKSGTVHNDDDDDDVDTIHVLDANVLRDAVTKEYNDAIAITQLQLVVLDQDKYKTI